MGLADKNVELIISEMKWYFEMNEDIRVKKIKDNYERKIQKLVREKENSMPYDVVRL